MWSVYLLRVLFVFSCICIMQWEISLCSVLRKYSASDLEQVNLELPVEETCSSATDTVLRPHSVSITEFGAVGDGKTLNTVAFQNAVFYVRSFADKGGAQLYVPRGRWLTGSFSLISHLTLYLDEGAVILASQDPHDWPLVEPLPSYGRGRELPGTRYRSLIYGEKLSDVIVTGANGTIDGQGSVWWNWHNSKTLNHTRGHLVEFVSSTNIGISNITLLNPPYWAIHPVYCSNVVIQSLTMIAPSNSPNTDGIQPDSCSDVCIEDCYISNGADVISIKSGWDEYGIKFGRPSRNIFVRRIVGESPNGAGIALGSEMSGGIANVQVSNITVHNSATGVQIKTGAGRGGYITNVSISGVLLHNVVTAIEFTGSCNDHPDNLYDPKAYPVIERICLEDIAGWNITYAGHLVGLKEAPFRQIQLSNITLQVPKRDDDDDHNEWECSDIEGHSYGVLPVPCPQLQLGTNLNLEH